MLPEAQPYFERAVAGSTTVLIAAHPASKNVVQWTKINLAACNLARFDSVRNIKIFPIQFSL